MYKIWRDFYFLTKDIEKSNSTRYNYKRIDIKGAQEELNSLNWKEELNGTVEDDKKRLKEILFNIQHIYVPTVSKGSKDFGIIRHEMF